MRRKSRVNLAAVLWTVVISFVVLTLMVVFLVAHFRKKSEAAAEAAAFDETAKGLSPSFSEQKTVALQDIGEVEALALVRAAFADSGPQALARHFILGKDMDPDHAMAALSEVAQNEGEITSFRWMGQNYSNGRIIGEVGTLMDAGGTRKNRLAQLVTSPDGKWRIDLDSYLRRSIPDWETILSGKSETSLVRVFIGTDSYYNGIYSDETKWRAYALVSPDVETILYGYVKRASPQDKALRRILDAEGESHRATIEIRWDNKAAPRQFEITGVPAENWVLGGARFDASF